MKRMQNQPDAIQVAQSQLPSLKNTASLLVVKEKTVTEKTDEPETQLVLKKEDEEVMPEKVAVEKKKPVELPSTAGVTAAANKGERPAPEPGTKEIVLLQPERFKRFYKNPARLQAICWVLAERGLSPYLTLCDADASDPLPMLCNDLVIDMTEASCESLVWAVSAVEAEKIYLINADRIAAEALRQQFPEKPFFCYTFAEFMENLDGIFRTDVSGSSAVPHPLMLSESMVKSFQRRGIQYFSEGTARGCEGNCTFCRLSCEQRRKLSFVEYSTADFIYSSSILLSRKLFVQLTDENFFGLSKSRLERVCDFALQLSRSRFNGILGVDTRIDTVPLHSMKKNSLTALLHDSWRLMMEAGLKYCFIGIESFDSNQLRRYRKAIDVSILQDVIKYLNSNNLFYTFGLILWDPLLSAEELRTSIDVIQDLGLLGKTASLIKPLRIIPCSAYEKQYLTDAGRYPVPEGGRPETDHIAAYYKDNTIRLMARLLFPIHRAFDRAGYRHSDVSLFEAQFDAQTPDILCDIPKTIAALEMQQIKRLLSCTEEQLLRMDAAETAEHFIPVIERILTEVAAVKNRDEHPDLAVILNYYSKVLSAALENLQLVVRRG